MRACPRSLTLIRNRHHGWVSWRYANTRGEIEHFKHYWAHGSITYWSCPGNVMHEKACHNHTSWCILFDVTSNGATHIMIQCQWLCRIRSGKEEKHHTTSLVDVVPDGQLSQNLPNPVRTLAAILHYQLKNETGIKISIMATSKLFGTQEKLLCQALKGVHYESGSQKCRREDAAHDKQEDSSSSEETDDDDDNEDEGAVTRIKPLKKKHKKWCETTDEKWKHVTPKSPHLNSLPSRPSTPTSSSLYSKFPNFPSQAPISHFQTILLKLKSHVKFKIQSISNYFY